MKVDKLTGFDRVKVAFLFLLMGWFANYVFALLAGFMFAIGGAIPWKGQYVLTLTLVIFGLWWTNRRREFTVERILITLAIWFFSSIFLYVAAEEIEVRRLQGENFRKVKSFCGGQLPPDCKVGRPYRADVPPQWECSGTVPEVAKRIQSLLGPNWKAQGREENSKPTNGYTELYRESSHSSEPGYFEIYPDEGLTVFEAGPTGVP